MANPGERHDWPADDVWAAELDRKLVAADQLSILAEELAGQRLAIEGRQAAIEEWVRATKTFRAALILCLHGYGQQAQILGRAIFESAMLIRWALTHRDTADEHAALHATLSLELYRDMRYRVGLWPDTPSKPLLSQEERTRAVELFGKKGTRYWTGHRGLHELTEEVLAAMDENEFSVEQLRALYAVPIGWSHKMTHGGGLSSMSHQSEDPNDPDTNEDTLVMVSGPSRAQVFDAILLVAQSYLLALDLIITDLAPHLGERLRDAGGLMWRSFKAPEELQGLADNDPCPCDEPGTTWGTCHKWTEDLVPLRREI